MADCFLAKLCFQLVETENRVFEATVVDLGIRYHLAHEHGHKRRVLRKNYVKQDVVHL